jgi:hypothetical protein
LRLTNSLSSASVHGWNHGGLPPGSMDRLIGSLVVEVPGGGVGVGTGLVVVVVEVTVVDRFVVRYLGGNSSSKSSELGTGGGLSAVTGSGGGSAAESGAEESTRCFVLGGGASTGRALCLERTGTGVVVRVVALGYSGPGAHHLGDFPAGVEDGLPRGQSHPFGVMVIGICPWCRDDRERA